MSKLGRKITDLSAEICDISDEKGFWDIEDISEFAIVPIKLALIGDEVSEALKVHREEYEGVEGPMLNHMTEQQEKDFTEELADIVIRTLDLAGGLGLDIGHSITDKIKKNKKRPHRHGKRY
jgi:NTP pyrophosphatase (non-canonical NTP hydrolase)